MFKTIIIKCANPAFIAREQFGQGFPGCLGTLNKLWRTECGTQCGYVTVSQTARRRIDKTVYMRVQKACSKTGLAQARELVLRNVLVALIDPGVLKAHVVFTCMVKDTQCFPVPLWSASLCLVILPVHNLCNYSLYTNTHTHIHTLILLKFIYLFITIVFYLLFYFVTITVWQNFSMFLCAVVYSICTV